MHVGMIKFWLKSSHGWREDRSIQNFMNKFINHSVFVLHLKPVAIIYVFKR